MGDIAELGLTIDASGALKATTALDGLTAAGGRTEGAFGRLKGAASQLGLALGAGVLFRSVLRETIEAQNAMAQLEAAVRATGGVAGRTTAELSALATALQRTTTYSDEAVMGAQSLLLTFTKIQGLTLDRATRDVTDLAARMGGDLAGAAMQLGKALQEPATGLTMLRRAGLTFDEAQIRVIKHLGETGRLAEAQALILTELESRFRGSAEAARNTLGGALAGLKNAFSDMLEVSRESSGGLIETVNGLARAFEWAGDVANRFFGGIALLAVDASVAWQKLLRFVRDVQVGMGGALSMMPGEGSRTLGRAMMREGLTGGRLTDAELEAWRREQYALVVGTDAVRAARGGVETGGETEEQERKRKHFQAAQADLAARIRTQLRLNAAFGETEHQVRLLTIAEEALTQKIKNAQEYSGRRLVEMNRLTDAMRDAKTVAAELEENLRLVALANEGMISRQAEQSEAWFEEERRRSEGRLNYTLSMNQEIVDAQAAQSEKWFEAMGGQTDSWKTMLKDMQRAIGDFWADVFNGGVNSFRSLFDAVRGLWSKMLGDLAAQKFRVAFESIGSKGGFNMAALGAGVTTVAAGGALALFTRAATAILGAAAATREWNAAIAELDKQFQAMLHGMDRTVAGMWREISGASELDKALAENAERFADLRAQLDVGPGVEYTARLRELNGLERERAGWLKKQADVLKLRDQIAAYTQTIGTLQDYAASLRLRGTPTQNYAEARAQYDQTLAAARLGDQAAAGKLPAAAQAFLDASRMVNASGVAYARDFAAVSAAVTDLAQYFEAQRTIAQQSLDALLGIQRNTAALITGPASGGGVPLPYQPGNPGAGGNWVVVGQGVTPMPPVTVVPPTVPLGGTGGGELQVTNSVLVAGFTAMVRRLDALTAQVVALTTETRHTGDALAVT